MKMSIEPFFNSSRYLVFVWSLKWLLAVAPGLGWAASAAAMDLTGWLCKPAVSCGTLGAAPNSVVTLPATEPSYGWVSTAGGVAASAVIPDSIKSYAASASNASRIDSPVFHANAGDTLSFNFNYVTSDGGTYTDFAWVRLLDLDDHDVAMLFTARTTPTLSADTVPGFNMPALATGLTLTPPHTPIHAPGYAAPSPGPAWTPLGLGSTGLCYAAGCGYTDWVHASYTIAVEGNYRLEFGVANWADTAYNSGLAFYGAKIGATLIEEEAKPDLVPHLSGPAELATNTHDHYTVTVTNQGGADSSDGALTVNLPANVKLDTGFFTLPSYCTPTVGPPGSFTCNLPAIASGASLPIDFVIASGVAGEGDIAGSVTGVTNESNTLNNDTALHVKFIVPPGSPDLITAIAGPAGLAAGATGDYTVSVTNIGSADSVDGMVVITLPSDVTVVAPASLPAYCHLTGAQITCDLSQVPPIPHIEPGEHVVIAFKLATSTPDHTGLIHATVTGVTGEKPADTANNSSTHLLNNTRLIPRASGSSAVPALGEAALLLLALTLAGGAGASLRRRS